MLRTTHVFAVVLSMAIPALAQDANNSLTSESECENRFQASDVNKDNVLTVTEVQKAENLPPALAKESLISRKQYMAACMNLPVVQVPQYDKPAPPSPHSTGVTVSPDNKGQQQPQGPTGPLETKSGGAPAESPQGQTPPGMQPAPDGSSKTIIDPTSKK